MSVLEVSDVAAYLRFKIEDTEAVLQPILDSAEAQIAHWAGPLQATEVVERVRGGADLILSTTPVISLTSATDHYGADVPVAGLIIDSGAGLVTSPSGTRYALPTYTVTYQAGHDQLPDDLKLAVMELVRHLWQTQRGPTARGQAEPIPGAAYALPNRVLELLQPYMLPSFA